MKTHSQAGSYGNGSGSRTMKSISILRSDRGTVLIIALLVLAVLSLIGAAAIMTTSVDIKISRSEKYYKTAFYNADSGISYVVAQTPSVDPPYPDPVPGVGNKISIADDSCNVYYLRQISAGPPKQIEIMSESSGGQGAVRIVAGVQYPTELKGALGGPGYEGAY